MTTAKINFRACTLWCKTSLQMKVWRNSVEGFHLFNATHWIKSLLAKSTTKCESSSGYSLQFGIYSGQKDGNESLPSCEAAVVMEMMAPYQCKHYDFIYINGANDQLYLRNCYTQAQIYWEQ
jgi:hypothetical protein